MLSYTFHSHVSILQTGNEASVDRLMKQITSFMSEISDEFKTVVVEAIRSVCIKFPRKHHILMTFLANMLREEVRNNFMTLYYSTWPFGQILPKRKEENSPFMNSVCADFYTLFLHLFFVLFLPPSLPLSLSQGGFDYKKAIVNTIIAIIEENSEIKDVGKNIALSNQHHVYISIFRIISSL